MFLFFLAYQATRRCRQGLEPRFRNSAGAVWANTVGAGVQTQQRRVEFGEFGCFMLADGKLQVARRGYLRPRVFRVHEVISRDISAAAHTTALLCYLCQQSRAQSLQLLAISLKVMLVDQSILLKMEGVMLSGRPKRLLDLHQQNHTSSGERRPSLTPLWRPLLFAQKVMNIKDLGLFLLETASKCLQDGSGPKTT